MIYATMGGITARIDPECTTCQQGVAEDLAPTPPHFNCSGGMGHRVGGHCTSDYCY